MFDFNLKNYGFQQLITCILLNVAGLVFIQSSVRTEVNTLLSQLLISIGSLIICILISFLNLKRFMGRHNLFLIIAIAILIFGYIFGTAYGRNSRRWISVPIINYAIQPSEFVKLLTILFLSKYIEKMDFFINRFGNLMKVIGLFSIPFLLIFFQPNLSSSLILFFIFVAMMFASKLKLRWFIGGGLIVLTIYLIIFLSVRYGFIYDLPMLRDYQKNRIVSFFEPQEKDETRYQQENSIIAIGSGKLIGKGINNDSTQSVKNGNWLAEAQNDFIFAVVGEEIGFLGSTIIILLYIFLVVSCFSIAGKQREQYKKLICVGVGAWLGIQTFINIGVATNLIPNTGIPLPFFSQGGSSLLSIYMALGFVLNIKRDVRG